MKKLRLAALLAAAGALSACDTFDYQTTAEVMPLQVSLADPAWDGQAIPAGQQCKKFGGNGATPPLKISGIPEGANAVIVAFSDRSWFLMDHGGHGMIGFWTGGLLDSVEIPAIAGETFELPQGVFLERQHQGGRGAPGAYLPPCSGGRGNRYFAEVAAVFKGSGDEPTRLLAEGEVFLGRY
ncbi:MAG: hypothetical protein R3E57_06825 [Porticoccaceae bacterium]